MMPTISLACHRADKERNPEYRDIVLCLTDQLCILIFCNHRQKYFILVPIHHLGLIASAITMSTSMSTSISTSISLAHNDFLDNGYVHLLDNGYVDGLGSVIDGTMVDGATVDGSAVFTESSLLELLELEERVRIGSHEGYNHDEQEEKSGLLVGEKV